MSLQRLLLRVLSSRIAGGPGLRLMRRRTWRVESGEGSGLRIRLPQNLDYLLGTSEIPVQQEIVAYLRAGDVFYDIGANVGFFSLMAARQTGPSGVVCSFEPVTENALAIRQNAALNGLENIRVVDVALGKAPCVAEFLLTEWDGGGTLASSAVRPTDPVLRRKVSVAALDDLIGDWSLPRPSFVKIDVEGAEMEVLEGMERTLDQCMPILLYEVDDSSKDAFDHRWRELDKLVASYGYRVRHLKSSYPNIAWHVGHSLALPPAARRRK